ncbi:UNVERIFIED_CONTAM: hypothetical protein Slati_4598100 [Sesamum latifolium]|uniref:Uncharacterized protein n=1 Tax=Sesamum latifolium TaxID=2727402 RepID=A0AAW2S1Y7_9LAMI
MNLPLLPLTEVENYPRPEEEEHHRQEEMNNRISHPEGFRTTLSNRAVAWFNQLPLDYFQPGAIDTSLSTPFLHEQESPKTIAFLFTIRQKENESLRDMQRFVEMVHEVPISIMSYSPASSNKICYPKGLKESIAGKPPGSMEDLLMRSQKYIWIEQSNASDPSHSVKRKGREEEKEPKKKEERKHLPPAGFMLYTPLNAPGGDFSRGRTTRVNQSMAKEDERQPTPDTTENATT